VKVALDTNVLASAIGTRGLCTDLLRVILLEHELVLGEQVLTELRKNLAKKFRFPPALIAENETLLRTQGVIATEVTAIAIAGVDSADARVLAEARAGGAEVFVTGDAGLQSLGTRAPVPVLSPRQFWVVLRGDE
jgi:predicted nucleic acid-binding protein